MAQWTAHQTSNLGVAGSSPARDVLLIFCWRIAFFSVGFVQYGTTFSRARGCSSLMFGLFEIKMWFMLASSHQVGWQTILFEQTTNKNNKQTTTNKQQTNNKHDGGFSASKHVLAPTKKSKITLRKLLLLIEKQKKIRCLNNSRPFCGRISFSSPTDVKVLFQSGPFLAM